MAAGQSNAVPGIHKKILEIQKKIEGLQKNGVGPATQGAYKFLSIDDVLTKVKPLLDEQGVYVHANLVDHRLEFTKALAKDDSRVPKVATSAFVIYDFEFVDTEDGSSIVTRVIGEGADTSDKAVRKATTSAWKIALIQTFTLITGETDPDAQDGANDPRDAPGAAAPKPSGDQRKIEQSKAGNDVEALRSELQDLAREQGREINEALDFADKITGVPRAVWTKDINHLKTVITAMKRGEV